MWIEFLVFFCIFLLIARLALPVVFPNQWRAADRAIMRGLGLPEETRFVAAAAVLLFSLAYGIVRACQYWRRRWLARRSTLQLSRVDGRSKA